MWRFQLIIVSKQIKTFGEKLNWPIFEKRDLVFAMFNPQILEPDWKSAGFVRVKKKVESSFLEYVASVS
jgi:hypothetical protein